MSELIAVVATAGILPLIVVLCILRGWSLARALALLLATVTAIATKKAYRRVACLDVVDKVTRKDEPPGWLRPRVIHVVAQPPETSTSSVPAPPPAIVPELPGTSGDSNEPVSPARVGVGKGG